MAKNISELTLRLDPAALAEAAEQLFVYYNWYETASCQEVAAFQWYLQIERLDMKP